MKKKIIVAPLNWGLGHASRCVPIINKIQKLNFIPVIASDGEALTFLQKEFPNHEFLELPSYKIKYGKFLKLSLALRFYSFLKVSKNEHQVLQQYLLKNKDVIGIISDNRFGIFSKDIPSIYVTHQINVLSGIFTFLTSYMHQKIIKRFDECWIPDQLNSLLSGKLSFSKNQKIKTKYIGVLSRLEFKEKPQKWDLIILLSGPEPRRSQIEEMLITKFKDYKGSVLLIQGKVVSRQKWKKENNIDVVNFMLKDELEINLNSAKKIIAKSGYSSIMDLSVLQKEVFFIPIKGQTEQEYLATYFKENYGVGFCSEDKLENLNVSKITFKKPPQSKTELNSDLFDLF